MEQSFAELSFSSAFSKWFKAHHQFIGERTKKDYLRYANPLLAFFQDLQLRHFNKGSLYGYQMWRWKQGERIQGETESPYCHEAESVRIRNEINCILKPMLREAGIWEEIVKKKFKHLPVPREGSGTPLTLEEQGLLLEVGFAKKKWQLAAHCQRVMYRTGTLFGELRKVRRKHVDLQRSTLTIIEGAKNNGPRHRTVVLVPSALESMAWIVARWEDHGGNSAEQYVLFHRTKGLDVPMGSTYRSWVAIVDATIEKHPGEMELIAKLERTRQCDGRTSAACLMLQNEKLSLPIIEKALGWTPNSHMRKRYHKATQNIQLDALMTLEDK